MRTLSLGAVVLLAVSLAGAKDDGAAIYKSKCAGCHGAQGEGKSGPKLAGTSLSEDDILNVLMKGGQPKAPHTKKFAGATDAKAKSVAAYVKVSSNRQRLYTASVTLISRDCVMSKKVQVFRNFLCNNDWRRRAHPSVPGYSDIKKMWGRTSSSGVQSQ